MVRFGCTIAFLFVLVAGQAQNNFRSAQTGDWNQSSTWEEFVAGSWQSTSNTPDFTSGTITIQSPHVITVTAAVTIDQATISIGGTVVVNDAITLTLNNGSGTDLTISGTIQVLGEGFVAGAGSLSLSGTMNVGSLNAAGAITSGTTEGNIRNSGLRTYSAASTTVYAGTAAQFIGSGHPNTSGAITQVSNANGVTFDQNCGSNTGATSRMSITGDLILTSGNLSVISVVGTARTLSLAGSVTDNGNFITVSGPSTNLLIEGSGDIPAFPFPPGVEALSQITINRPSNTVVFNNALVLSTRLTVSGNAVMNGTFVGRDLSLNSGTVDFNSPANFTGSITMDNGTTLAFDDTSLSLANNYISTGLLACSGTSTLTLTGTVELTSPLNFTPGSSLQTLSINKSTAGTSVTFASPVTVNSSFTLTSGNVSNVGNSITMASNSTLTRTGGAFLLTSSPSGGPWNLIYTGSSVSTGFEIPTSGSLNSLTVNSNSLAVVTLTQAVTISGALTVNVSRTFTSGANDVTAGTVTIAGTLSAPTSAATTGLTVNGNFVNNGTFVHNGGTLVVGGPVTMSGTSIATTNFSSISIAGAGTLTAPSTLNIAGDLTNNGSFAAGTGTVVFNGGASALLGTNMPTTSFNHVTINTGATLTQASNFTLGGNLIVNGNLTVGTGTTTFAGTTALTGTNIATTQFNHIVINPASTLTAPTTTLRVGGNFTNNGTFTAGTSTVIFTGTSSLLGANINTTIFNNVTINGGATLNPATLLTLQGSFANSGTFNAASGTVLFAGNSGGKTISGTANTQFFNLSMNKSNGGTSVTVSSAQTVTNSLTLTRGIMDNTGGTLTLNSGTTLTRVNTGSIVATPAGGPWNLIYQGLSIITSVEIPATGILLSLTIDVDIARNVTLAQSVTVQNAITINNPGRTLLCGNLNVTAGSIVNGGTFSAPNNASVNGLIVSGNFTNNGTYTHNNGLITFSGTSTILGTTAATFNRLTITGTLTAGANFNVASHFTNNGTYNAGTGLVTFTGAVLQNIQGSAPLTTFRGLRVTNTASPVSVSVQVNVNLVDSLSLGANAKFDADGSAGTAVFTLLSTSDAPAQDAKICRLPAGAVVQGSVTVQRFFRPADNFDRFFSSPVTNATVAMVQASTPAGSFPVTGGFPGTSFPCTGCTNDGDNFRYYIESTTGIINKGYKGFITSTSSTLVPGVGYDAFMWNGVSNTLLSLRGPINSGTIALGIVTSPTPTSIMHTNNGVPSADGWNLVGNPYPSPIQWNNGAGWTKTNIDPTVWVWDVVGRVWHSYNANTSTGDLTNGVITSGQGFWVYAPAVGAASISVNEQAKSFGISGTGSYFRTASAGDRRASSAFRISLTKGESTDNSFIVMDPEASLGVDEGLDAPKLRLGIEHVSIALVNEGRIWGHMALGNQLPEVLPLSMLSEDAGPASISFEVPDSYAALAGYYLVDSYLVRSVLVGSGKPYSFDIIEGDPLSQGERFYLSKYPLVEKTILSTTLRMSAHPNPATNVLSIELNTEQVEEMALLDYAGRPVIRINPVVEDGVTKANVDVSQQPSGLYVLKVMAAGTLMTQKIVISH